MSEVVSLLNALNITQKEAAIFLGVEERSVRRWVAGQYAVPTAVLKLLRLIVRMGLSPYEAEYWTAQGTGE